MVSPSGLVATAGLEPAPTDPESAVLPLHHVAMKNPSPSRGAKNDKKKSTHSAYMEACDSHHRAPPLHSRKGTQQWPH